MQWIVSFEQFLSFTESLWMKDDETPYLEGGDNFWPSVASFEATRRFNPGHSHCPSRLSFSPRDGWEWVYTTTSHTRLEVKQAVFDHGRDLPAPKCTIDIPDGRCADGRIHYDDLMVVLGQKQPQKTPIAETPEQRRQRRKKS